jgi:signal transduction histidine kinase
MQLLKNAFKHSGSNSTVSISTKDNSLIFSDNGSGISPDDLAHIFNRFFTKHSNSTGLGLAFCKMVMEALNGSIKCTSELGKGTTFILNFPA